MSQVTIPKEFDNLPPDLKRAMREVYRQHAGRKPATLASIIRNIGGKLDVANADGQVIGTLEVGHD